MTGSKVKFVKLLHILSVLITAW